MKINLEPMERHGFWFGRKLFLHLLRKFRRRSWLIADAGEERRRVIVSLINAQTPTVREYARFNREGVKP